MADIDLARAKNLLKSAKNLYNRGDFAGVAGLAYQAFESAVIALTARVNGMDYKSHSLRRERAKELVSKFKESIDFLWEIRNIDFYGNVNFGEEKREISKEEIKHSLEIIKKFVNETEIILKGDWYGS